MFYNTYRTDVTSYSTAMIRFCHAHSLWIVFVPLCRRQMKRQQPFAAVPALIEV